MPPDLSRLGDELTAAAARAVAERRRRRRRLARVAASAAAGVLSAVVLAPAALSPDSGSASLLAREVTGTFLVRPPERPPVTLARYMRDQSVGSVHPSRRPLFPSLTVRRNA